ncbi:hypothetical protein N752_19725 [Desulforamulus aquiferis]|nr:hypothetical protein [Desulforamulus aquiferis]RYD03410.1 hypothetical protein N752_19725 [Desulforamulus aquiferis]
MRRIFYLLSILVFLSLIFIGINTTSNHFNLLVLPEEPLRAFEVLKNGEGGVEIHLLGEMLEIDFGELELRTAEYYKAALQDITSVKGEAESIGSCC